MTYLQIDREKLTDYLAKNIEHSENPQSFNQQMEVEISRHLKSHEDHLKQLQSKMKIKKMEESQIKEREGLRKKLEEKSKHGAEKKIKMIEERVQSMAALRQRKQEYMAEKLAVSRKESLKQSLQKIKNFQEKTSRMEHLLASKSASESKLFLTSSSRVEKKREYLNTEYEHTVQKLKEKGIFDLPDKHKLNDLYAKKVKFVKAGLQKKKEEDLNKIGETLQKINEARKKKEKIIKQKTEKLRNMQIYQHQLKTAKFQQLKKLQTDKTKRIQKKLSEKLTQAHSRLETMSNMNTNNHNISASRKQQTEPQIAANHNQHSSYKHEIRKQIESFMKQQGALK